MDLKDMRLFLAIAEEKTLTRAAQKNRYTQSAASHILKNLEEELGFPLFSRTQKGLTLTKNGSLLLPHVRRILSAAECFEQESAAIRGIQTGHISIGTYLSASVHWLPPALEQFFRDHPHMTVEIQEGNFHDIETWLENGTIDFSISSPPDSPKMDWLPLKQEQYLAVCGAASPYAKQENFNLHEVSELPYIEEAGEIDLIRQFQKLGIAPLIPRFSSLNTYSMISMVRHNLGVCILPELVLRGNTQNVVTLPLDPPLFRSLGIRIPSLKKASPATVLLIEQIRKTVWEMEGEALDDSDINF